MPVKHLLKFGFRNRPDLLVDDLTTLEEQQGRNSPNAESRGSLLVGINVQLADLYLSDVIGRYLVHRGSHHPAWSAPFSPEVHKHRDFRLKYILVKGRIRKGQRVVACHISFSNQLM